jgi:membrane fusion protein, heavy metal efflux system
VSKRPSASATRAVAALLVLAGFATGCTGNASAVSDTTAVVKPSTFTVTDSQRARLTVITLADTTFRPSLEVTATVAFNGDHSTQVLSPISGPVRRLLVNTGSVVSAGTPMATVSSPDYASAVSDYRKAVDAANNANRILKLDEQLYQNDALARSDLDQARTDASQAAADVDASVQALRSLGLPDSTIDAVKNGKLAAAVEGVIPSPIPGVVVEKLINPGQLLEAGATPTFTVADLSTMWVMASVYPSDLDLVHEGESVSIYTDASPTPVHGRVDYVAALVDPGTKATAVRVVADNAARLLKKDMFVRVDIHSRSSRRGLVIPSSALLRDEDNLPFVFVALPDGSFARRRITYGYRVGDGYEVTSGLAAGDKVLANGALFIQFAESQ